MVALALGGLRPPRRQGHQSRPIPRSTESLRLNALAAITAPQRWCILRRVVYARAWCIVPTVLALALGGAPLPTFWPEVVQPQIRVLTAYIPRTAGPPKRAGASQHLLASWGLSVSKAFCMPSFKVSIGFHML